MRIKAVDGPLYKDKSYTPIGLMIIAIYARIG